VQNCGDNSDEADCGDNSDEQNCVKVKTFATFGVINYSEIPI